MLIRYTGRSCRGFLRCRVVKCSQHRELGWGLLSTIRRACRAYLTLTPVSYTHLLLSIESLYSLYETNTREHWFARGRHRNPRYFLQIKLGSGASTEIVKGSTHSPKLVISFQLNTGQYPVSYTHLDVYKRQI